VNLPRQPVVNGSPWLVAGIILALLFLCFVVLAWYKHKNETVTGQKQDRVEIKKTIVQ